jgi:RimJ/RimL family protein N-acetyltransferase
MLEPILRTNYAYLAPWIPARIATPAPLPALENRLSTFATMFSSDTEWRYAMFLTDSAALLGEISIFPRSADARVAFSQSTCAEIGYWMRQDFMGRGFVTECVRAVMNVLLAVPRFAHVEIRCDERNAPSTAIPERVGFTLTETTPDGLQIWTHR